MGRPAFSTKALCARLPRSLASTTSCVNKMVSAKVRRLGISAEASLILLAEDHGIGTATYLCLPKTLSTLLCLPQTPATR